MCTASWLIRSDGFELFFNRDESRRRGPASAPERLERDGVRLLAPRDADAGGTWLGVNEHGLALGLLNGRDVGAAPETPRSRGLLVHELLSARDGDEVRARLARQDLGRHRGFLLTLFEAGREPWLFTWDGTGLVAERPVAPLCSSSLDRGRAQRERERLYRERVEAEAPTRDSLERFHASHEPERGPWSPCMHREDARTVSASQVRVDARSVALRYAPGPPCRTPFGPWLELERVQRAG